MEKNKFEIEVIKKFEFNDIVYSCSFSNLIGDETPEIIGCSLDDNMQIFDLTGKLLMNSEYSSQITFLIVASILNDSTIELLSGDLRGHIRLMGKNGNLIWSKKLSGPIISIDIGTITQDKKYEILVIVENNRYYILNNYGEIIQENHCSEKLIDCTVSELSEKLLGNIILLSNSGNIINFNIKNNWQILFSVDFSPTCIKSINVEGNNIFLIGDKHGALRLIDYEGDKLCEYNFDSKIRCISKIYSFQNNQNFRNYIAIASGENIFLIKLTKSKEIIQLSKRIKQIKELQSEQKSETIQTPILSFNNNKENQMEQIKVLRGGIIEGGKYIFKIKIINDRDYNITDANIQILSYPEDSLELIKEESRETYPDRIKIHKIPKGSFISPKFIFAPKNDCIKGKIKAVINYLNEKDEIETIIMEPYQIKVICGLLNPKQISLDEFNKLSQDIITFKSNGEELDVNINGSVIYEKLLILLQQKNFAIVHSEKNFISDRFFGTIKAFAEGKYTKNQLGLQLTLTGNKNENESKLKIESFAEDIDMTPSLINEIENNITLKECPSCGHNIPTELQFKILKGKEVLCEICGASLIDINRKET